MAYALAQYNLGSPAVVAALRVCAAHSDALDDAVQNAIARFKTPHCTQAVRYAKAAYRGALATAAAVLSATGFDGPDTPVPDEDTVRRLMTKQRHMEELRRRP